MAIGLNAWPERLPPWLGLALAAAGANAIWLAGWSVLGTAAAVIALLQASLRPGLPKRLAWLGSLAIYSLAVGLFRLAMALPAGAPGSSHILMLAADALRLPLAAGIFQVFIGHFGLGHIRSLVSWLPDGAARQAALALWLPAHLSRSLPAWLGQWRAAVVRAEDGRGRPAVLQVLRACPTLLPWLWRGLEDLAGRLGRRWPDAPPDAAID
jgi:hypothetical protein